MRLHCLHRFGQRVSHGNRLESFLELVDVHRKDAQPGMDELEQVVQPGLEPLAEVFLAVGEPVGQIVGKRVEVLLDGTEGRLEFV